MEDSSLNDQGDMLDRIKQFVAEELEPISLKVEDEGRIPVEIVDKMR